MKIFGSKAGRWVAIMAVLTLTAAMAYGSKAVSITANLVTTCTGCQTDVGNNPNTGGLNAGDYSLLDDTYGAYPNSGGVSSQILTNNSVYNLTTTNTLVNGLVAPTTRTVDMHFYSPYEGVYSNDYLPACWSYAGADTHQQDQAVNWNIYSSNAAFTQMVVGQEYDGSARMDFNVRNAQCDQQIFRFYLKWGSVCITRTSATTWTATGDACGTTLSYGTASLYGQGGTNKQTLYYGDWRETFKITLSTP
jgi:hypothetical protein